ncbi:MAG: hypothetical protein Q9220_002489 [cf. Caloplaca sp. 1 TL-2023]
MSQAKKYPSMMHPFVVRHYQQDPQPAIPNVSFPPTSSDQQPQSEMPDTETVYDADNELTSSDKSFTVIGDSASSTDYEFASERSSTLLDNSSEARSTSDDAGTAPTANALVTPGILRTRD